jgi:putative DNA primase/helicase
MDTVERARGRWLEILPLLGVSANFLRNRHGPCPMCGGKDRFRYDDKNGDGTYFCNQCGPGNGLSFIKKFKGWNHREACDEIDRIVGSERRQIHRAVAPVSDNSRRADALRKLLAAAGDDAVVDAYLERRGLGAGIAGLLGALQGHAACPYYGEDHLLVGHFPAVLGRLQSPDGDLVSVQRIYDHPQAVPRKKMMPPVGTVNGGAVRLYAVDDEVGVCEGIETAIAARLLFNIPVWAAISAHGLEVFEPPQGVFKVHIFGDNDANYEGQGAAAILARRMARKKLEICVNIPDEPGTDWLDVYLGTTGKPRSHS